MSVHSIQVWGEAVGLAVETARGFRFFAADSRAAAIDGAVFETYGQARLAAIGALRSLAGVADLASHGPEAAAALAAAARSLDRVPA